MGNMIGNQISKASRSYDSLQKKEENQDYKKISKEGRNRKILTHNNFAILTKSSIAFPQKKIIYLSISHLDTKGNQVIVILQKVRVIYQQLKASSKIQEQDSTTVSNPKTNAVMDIIKTTMSCYNVCIEISINEILLNDQNTSQNCMQILPKMHIDLFFKA
ncbi:hypothetical protein H5410_026616 [Solanum commersonii]|uniref:Uncharacterized protein n=1 Tax=Solanum commersonii TaxID=4109 RepID=A0A9J5Z168_SOLCO|nr:hypothetical protein H5410_026616 [Solanum commersonii]